MKKVTHTHVPASEAPANSTLYYMYSQNNTGGRFDVDDEVAHYVLIEATSPEDSDRIAQSHGIYFDHGYNRDCSCCGTRWSEAGTYDATKTPQIYGKSVEEALADNFGGWRKKAIVYYIDGSKPIYETIEDKS